MGLCKKTIYIALTLGGAGTVTTSAFVAATLRYQTNTCVLLNNYVDKIDDADQVVTSSNELFPGTITNISSSYNDGTSIRLKDAWYMEHDLDVEKYARNISITQDDSDVYNHRFEVNYSSLLSEDVKFKVSLYVDNDKKVTDEYVIKAYPTDGKYGKYVPVEYLDIDKDGVLMGFKDGCQQLVATNNYVSLVVPNYVTSIADEAFTNMYFRENGIELLPANIRNLYIEDNSNLLYIGTNAFASTALKNIELSSNYAIALAQTSFGCLESIENVTINTSIFTNRQISPALSPFSNSNMWDNGGAPFELTVGPKCQSIGQRIFHTAEITSINIDSPNLSIGNGAFINVNTLNSIKINVEPDKSIGDNLIWGNDAFLNGPTGVVTLDFADGISNDFRLEMKARLEAVGLSSIVLI